MRRSGENGIAIIITMFMVLILSLLGVVAHVRVAHGDASRA